jgi:hypothetical protein
LPWIKSALSKQLGIFIALMQVFEHRGKKGIAHQGSIAAVASGQPRWSMGFTSDQLSDGRWFGIRKGGPSVHVGVPRRLRQSVANRGKSCGTDEATK